MFSSAGFVLLHWNCCDKPIYFLKRQCEPSGCVVSFVFNSVAQRPVKMNVKSFVEILNVHARAKYIVRYLFPRALVK